MGTYIGNTWYLEKVVSFILFIYKYIYILFIDDALFWYHRHFRILFGTFGFFQRLIFVQGLFIGVFSYIITPRRIEGGNPLQI